MVLRDKTFLWASCMNECSYEGAFESLGKEPFSDNYASLMLNEDGLNKGRELVESAFPGESFEIARARGPYSGYFDKNTTFDEYYSCEGSAYGVVLHKQVTEDVLAEDAEKLQEVLNGEKDFFQMATATVDIKVIYYSDDAHYLKGSDYADFEKLSDYDAVLDVMFSMSGGDSSVKEMEIAGK